MTHDLVLSMRNVIAMKNYKSQSKVTVNHIYLCDKHAEDMDLFMKVYKGKEKDA